MNSRSLALIDQFGLQPHPEGGFYRETFRSATRVRSDKHVGERAALTCIYFLLDGSQYSAWHKVASDESWLFHVGSDLDILMLESSPDPESSALRITTIGQSCGAFETTVPAGTWFAVRPTVQDGFSLVSCVVSPGFEFADFVLATRDHLTDEGYGAHPDWPSIESFLSNRAP